MNNHKLAVRIAKRILSMNHPQSKPCYRIQLMERLGDGQERGLGGKNLSCLTEEIEEILNEVMEKP